jgi:hypothetical protein
VPMLVEYPPKHSVSVLVNTFKGTSSRLLGRDCPTIAARYWMGVLWSPSYFAASTGARRWKRSSGTSNNNAPPPPPEARGFRRGGFRRSRRKSRPRAQRKNDGARTSIELDFDVTERHLTPPRAAPNPDREGSRTRRRKVGRSRASIRLLILCPKTWRTALSAARVCRAGVGYYFAPPAGPPTSARANRENTVRPVRSDGIVPRSRCRGAP